jgi:beta-ketoacyl-acyl-carrier-protein synthase II
MSDARRRVAVTGIGLVTPLGNDAAATWNALLEGRSGVGPIAGFDASGFPVRIAAEVKDFDALARLGDAKLLKLANRAHRFALAAADEAIADAGVRPDETTAARWACVAGAGMLGWDFDDLSAFQREFAADGELHEDRLFAAGHRVTDPVAFCRAQANAGLALLTRRFAIRGYASTVHTACASGGQAIGAAMRLVRRGIADRALCGGFDSMLHPLGLAGFCLLQALSPDNDAPERASRPFDRTRNGFVLGEGAGFLVLEEWELARRRGARIHAELAGDGNSLSSYRITDSHPSGDGPIQAMRQALGDAGLTVREIDYVNAHGTSTPMNDRGECAAIRALFGAHADHLAVSSTKSLMGHLIAAAGAVEAAVTALAVRDGVLPVNANLAERDPDCDLDFVVGQARRRDVRAALSSSFGFGGSNSCLVLRHADGGMA